MFFSDFFSEVLNLNKFLRIVFIFLRILGDFEEAKFSPKF